MTISAPFRLLTLASCWLAGLLATGVQAQSPTATATATAPQEDMDRLLRLVSQHVLGADADGDHSVEAPSLHERLQLPRCAVSPETFDPPGNRSGSRRTVGLRCPESWTLYVPVRITQRVPMVELLQAVGPGEVLTAAHLSSALHPLDSMPLGYVSDPAQLIGAIVRQPLPEGTVLRPTHVRAGNAVVRGQRVRLIVQREGLRVESQGEALADAALGHWVRARNPLSGRIVEGRVSAPGVLTIP